MSYFTSKKMLQKLTSLFGGIALVMFMACHENTVDSEIVFIGDGDYMYLARVTAPYTESDSQIPPGKLPIQVYVFNDHVREKVGARISRNQVLATRDKPPGGWGTRQVALQYFQNNTWIYAEDVTEFEDHYLLSINGEKRTVDLKEVRFPIPVRRY